MSKYLLFIEIYCFIYSIFSVISSNNEKNIDKNNSELVEFEFLPNIDTYKNKNGVLYKCLDYNGQNLRFDLLLKSSTDDIDDKKFKLVTNSYIEFKYNDVKNNVITDDTYSKYNINENMFGKAYGERRYLITFYGNVKESCILENLDYLLKNKRFNFVIYIEQLVGDKYYIISNKFGIVCHLTDEYYQKLREIYKKNNEENKGNNKVNNEDNKDGNKVKNEDNINNKNVDNDTKKDINNEENNKKIEDEMNEIFKDESNNNEIFNYLNNKKNDIKKIDEDKSKILKNKDFFDKEKELNNKINSNINEKLNNIDNKMKNDEFFNNSSSKKCCKNKKMKKQPKKSVVKNKFYC